MQHIRRITSLEEDMKVLGFVVKEEKKEVQTSEQTEDKNLSKEENLEEALRAQRLKRHSSSERAKGRKAYRKNRSKIRQKLRRLRRKPAFKRRQKRIKAMKRGRSAGSRRRFVVAGLGSAATLSESLLKYDFSDYNVETLTSILGTVVSISENLENKFDEMVCYLDEMFDLEEADMDFSIDDDGWVEVDDENMDDDCECDDEDMEGDEEEYAEESIVLGARLGLLREQAEDLMNQLKSSAISPDKAQALVTDMVKYLSGAVKAYIDVAKDVEQYERVGKDMPDESNGKPDVEKHDGYVGKDDVESEKEKPEKDDENSGEYVGEKGAPNKAKGKPEDEMKSKEYMDANGMPDKETEKPDVDGKEKDYMGKTADDKPKDVPVAKV